MKTILLRIALVFSIIVSAQDGNTIATAITVDGTDVDVNVLNFNSATESGMAPSCISSEDVYYKHVANEGDNKITIGMTSAAIALVTSINYQILVAPENDMSQLQELECDAYTVLLIVGGSFQYVIEDVEAQNTYFLRVYKTTSLGGSLTDLLNGTTITMESDYDSTLSTDDLEENTPDIIVSTNDIKIKNDSNNFNSYKIYGLDGKKIQSSVIANDINTIDIAYLSKGIYVLNLNGDNSNYAYKFVKY